MKKRKNNVLSFILFFVTYNTTLKIPSLVRAFPFSIGFPLFLYFYSFIAQTPSVTEVIFLSSLTSMIPVSDMQDSSGFIPPSSVYICSCHRSNVHEKSAAGHCPGTPEPSTCSKLKSKIFIVSLEFEMWRCYIEFLFLHEYGLFAIISRLQFIIIRW